MLSFRHHVISLVAVFLALAVGVALGGGPLSDADEASGGSTSRSSGAPAPDDEQTDAEGGDPGDAATYADTFAVAAGSRLYGDSLAAAPVAVVAMPGVDKDALKSLSAQIQAAGGRVTGRYGIRDSVLDAGERSLIDTLGSQLATQLGDPRLSADASTYERLGQAIGVAVATADKAPVTAPATALQARDVLSQASLVATPSVAVAAAPLVLVVLGPESDADQTAVEIQTALVTGLAGTAAGVVVAGSAASAEDGTLAGLRSASLPATTATVDGADTPLGEVGTVLALVGVLGGRGGAFGPASADGGVPLA